jgi:hypothetical protein
MSLVNLTKLDPLPAQPAPSRAENAVLYTVLGVGAACLFPIYWTWRLYRVIVPATSTAPRQPAFYFGYGNQ